MQKENGSYYYEIKPIRSYFYQLLAGHRQTEGVPIEQHRNPHLHWGLWEPWEDQEHLEEKRYSSFLSEESLTFIVEVNLQLWWLLVCVSWHCWGFGRENNDERCLTDNFHVDICCIFPSRVSNHNRVDSLILPFSTLNSEDTVALGGFHMDPTISLCDDLHEDNHQSFSIILSKVAFGNLCCTFLKMMVGAGSIMIF